MQLTSKLHNIFNILFCFFGFFIFNLTNSFAQIIINEVQSQNTNTICDEDGDTPDWIELYNSSDKQINMLGYSISDDINDPNKWIFPEMTIEPNGYLTIFASGKESNNQILGQKNSSLGFGHWRYSDDFSFNYIEVKGDFDISAQIRYFDFLNDFSESGIMIREDLDARSRYTGCFFTNKLKFYIHINPSITPEIDQKWFKEWDIDQLMEFPNVWTRLVRKGDSIEVYFSETGKFWHYYTSFLFQLKKTCFIGIAQSSFDEFKSSTLFIKNILINGNITKFEDLQHIDFGEKSKSQSIVSKFHLPFNLKKDGDSIFLFDNYQNLSSKLIIPFQKGDISYGFNDNMNLKFFQHPTPGFENSFGKQKISVIPLINIESGIFSSPMIVEFQKLENSNIFYTTDCNIPDSSSIKWDGKPILIDTSTIIRAVSYSEDAIPSEIITKSYLIEPFSEIPTISIVSEPDNFFSNSNGILVLGNHAEPEYPYLGANFLQKWEIPGTMFYFDQNQSRFFSSNCGITLQGGGSRYLDQKPIKIISRKRYDDEFFNFPFFLKNSIINYKRLLLRTCSDDWYQTMLKDPLSNILMNELNIPEHSKYSPSRVFLNGLFWGLYNFQDRVDLDYIAQKYGIPENEITILEFSGYPLYGDNSEFFLLIDKLKKFQYEDNNLLAFLDSNINIANFIDYVLIQFFTCNVDWPLNNLRIWNAENFSKKWEWIAYDFDFTFQSENVFSDFFTKLDTNSTFNSDKYNVFQNFFKYFINNPTLKNKLFSRFQDVLNYTFSPNITLGIFDSLITERKNLINQHLKRWPNSLKDYQKNIEDIKYFLQKRPHAILKNVVNKYYSIDLATINLRPNIKNAGNFIFNSLSNIEEISGEFIRELPITIVAKPNKGYKFIGWNIDTTTLNSITIYPDKESMEIIAYFEKIEGDEFPKIVINEIMYKSPDSKDTKDWIELYNNSDSAIDLTGWIFKDFEDTHTYIIDSATIIKPEEYLVLINDKSEFNTHYPFINNYQGSFDFGLGRGDLLRIFNEKEELIDFVKYESTDPWPIDADGKGSSLELIHPNLDNNLFTSWVASSKELGTPGEINSKFDSIKKPENLKTNFSIFPNPASSIIQLHVPNKINEISSILIFDILGTQILSEINNSIFLEKSNLVFDISFLSKGLYFLQISYLDEVNTFKTETLKFIVN